MSAENLTGFLRWLDRTLATESLAELPDHQILKRFISNYDETAFRVIVSRHGPMIYRVCRRVLSDDQDTEDAFQATFVILIRKARSIRKRKSLASWLHGVAYQVALRLRTSSQKRRTRELRTGCQNNAIVTDDRSWKDVRAILDEELDRLPEKLRSPLVLCYLEGLTQDEAAEQLGQSKRTLRRYLQRGRTLLSERLTRRGLELSGAMMVNLLSECVEAIPPELAATTILVETAQTGQCASLSQRIPTVVEEVIKTMSVSHWNLKWIAVAILGAVLGSAALGSLFAEGHSDKASTASVSPKGVLESTLPVAQQKFETSVTTAREAAIGFLKKTQTKEGTWEKRVITGLAEMEGGATALATLSLLEAGVPATDETIKHAVDYLITLPPKKTYVVSLQTQALARVDAKKHKDQIQRNADWLVKEEVVINGNLRGWSYPGNSIPDGSNTHFAVMGLHAAKQAGCEVDDKIWKQVAELYLTSQQTGGWGYYGFNETKDPCTTSMTACAVLGLATASRYTKDTKVLNAAFEKGLKLLTTWDLENPKGTGYAMMVVAELGRARGKKEFKVGNKTWEWYRVGAEKIIKSQKEDGSLTFAGSRGVDSMPLLSTSFGLFFLGPPEGGAPQIPAKPKEENQGMTPEAISAWEAAGAQYGRLEKVDAGYVLFLTGPPKNGELPAFNVKSDLKISELPAPNAPFGLVCRRIENLSLKELASLKHLQSLDLNSTSMKDADLKELAPLTQLLSLDLSNTQVTDAGMKELAPLNQLQTLDLGQTKVSDEGMKELAAFKQLRTLFLSGAQVTDLGVKHLSALTQMETLGLNRLQITNAGLKGLAGFNQLQMLHLTDTKVTEAGLKELAALTRLHMLSLTVPNATEAGMKELVALKRLQTLALSNMQITEGGMKEVGNLAGLQRLTLTRVSVQDGGMKHLASLKQLHTLELTLSQVTDAASKELGTLTQIQKLSLIITQITDIGLKEVAALKQLQELRLAEKVLMDAGVKELAALKQLKILGFSGGQVTDSAIKELTALKELRTLLLSETQMTEAGLKELAAFKELETLAIYGVPVTEAVVKELATLKQLRTLSLYRASVTDLVVKELALLKQIQTLDLRKTLVTDAGIQQLLALKELRTLELHDSPVTDSGVEELRKALPMCRIYK